MFILKKSITIPFAFILSFCAVQIFALPVGNPSNPAINKKGIFSSEESKVSTRIGYEGSIGFDRRLEQYQESSGRVDEFELMTNSGIITLNLCNRVDLFAVLGASEIDSTWRVSTPTTLSQIKAKTNQDLVWTVGTNIALFEWNRAVLGIGGRYLYTNPSLNSLQIDGVQQNTASSKMLYREWQANVGLSYKIGFLIPYVGGQFSWANNVVRTPFVMGIADDGGNVNHFDSRDLAGMYVGCTILLGKVAFITAEARLFDEEAVTISADLRF